MTKEREKQLVELHKESALLIGTLTNEEKQFLNELVKAGELEPFVLYHRHGQCDMNISRRAFEALKHLYWYYGCAPTNIVAKNDAELMENRYPVLREYFRQIPPECMEKVSRELQKGLIELDLFVREMYFSGKLLVDGMTCDEFNNSFATTEA